MWERNWLSFSETLIRLYLRPQRARGLCKVPQQDWQSRHGFSAHLCGPMRRSRWVPTEVSALIQGPRRSCPPCLGWNLLKKMTCAHEPFPPDAHPSPPASILCVYNTGVQPKGQHIFSPQSCHQTQGKGNTRHKQVWGSRNKVHTSTKKVFPWFEPQSSGLLGQP